MKKNPIETILGVFVLVFTALFLFFASSRIDKKEIAGYTVKASFSKVGGLEVGSDVRIAGIKVGSVLATKLDQETYAADVFMNINSDVKLPIDTVAGIADVGIMGDKYIRLEPGKSQALLSDGDQIMQTKNYKSLEDSVSEFIFLSTK
ncbi:MAG: outer membrane lipid asymmetry maintenance protein MlaD [Alphaproteobacteria bacterium]|nr:outer membrane lipid asymmetry maintenance protein MlaD [Alphaproteobacteria bacterium]